jgi:hypothetical protein
MPAPSPDLTVSRILSSQDHEGWDFATGKFVDLFEVRASLIQQRLHAVRCKMQHQQLGTLLTANYAIVQDE